MSGLSSTPKDSDKLIYPTLLSEEWKVKSEKLFTLHFSLYTIKGISLIDISCIIAFHEPFYALFRGAMGEGIGNYLPLHTLLNSIITYGIGSAYGLIYIIGVKVLLVIVCPYACIEIGLELKSY